MGTKILSIKETEAANQWTGFYMITASVMKELILPCKRFALFASIKEIENDEKRFLFHLKSSFHSEDIYISVLRFCSCRRTDLMTPEPG